MASPLSVNFRLAQLWRNKELVDVELVFDDGTRIHAHKIVLAAASGFFYAQLCGSGRHMLQVSVLHTRLLQHTIIPRRALASPHQRQTLRCPMPPRSCSCHCASFAASP